MGPYIPRRQKQAWEYDVTHPTAETNPSPRVLELLELLENGNLDWEVEDRLHGGVWIGNSDHLQCLGRLVNGEWARDCAWRSYGEPGHQGGIENPHVRQWNTHRVVCGLADGVLSEED